MARKRQRTVNFFKEETVKNMKELGVYKPEYDEIIAVYATMLYQYHVHYNIHEVEGFMLEIIDGDVVRANPRVRVLENLRKDLKMYSDALQLNAKRKTVLEKKKSKLDELVERNK